MWSTCVWWTSFPWLLRTTLMLQTRPSDWWRQQRHLCRRHGDECATHCRGRPEKLKASYRQEQPRGFPIRATSACVKVIFEDVGTLHVQNKEFKRVLRKLHHNHFAWVHLTFMSKYRKTRLPIPCTAFSMWTSWGLVRGVGGRTRGEADTEWKIVFRLTGFSGPISVFKWIVSSHKAVWRGLCL